MPVSGASSELFTREEWAVLSAHGSRVGMVAGLVCCIALGIAGAIAFGLTGDAPTPQLTMGVIAALLPVNILLGLRMRRRLPEVLRAKVRRHGRQWWWVDAIGLGLICGTALAVWAIGWPAWVMPIAVVVVAPAWMPADRRLRVEP